MIKKEAQNITVVGAGYVGLSLAVLLARKNNVIAFDISQERVDKINDKKPIFKDDELERILRDEPINLKATTDEKVAFSKPDFIIIAAPTDFDEKTERFNTSIIESIIGKIKEYKSNAVVVIKSTIPVGFTKWAREKLGYANLIFSPEFLREGRAVHDNIHPSRVIVGTDEANPQLVEGSKKFAELMQSISEKGDAPILIMPDTEAEAVKLFSNSYLASRVAFFNELDTFAEVKGLCTKNIIDGMCLDPRIGLGYNNPSFGYGGYCFPKDTKQLLSIYLGVPNNVVAAIVTANETRKKFIAKQIFEKAVGNGYGRPCIGIYRLTMKAGSDNFRSSSIRDVMESLREMGGNVFVYEPTLDDVEFEGYPVVKDLAEFKNKADIIVANRIGDDIRDVSDKVYTRDVYGRD